MAEDDATKPDTSPAIPRRKRPPVTIDLAAEPDENSLPPPVSETVAGEPGPGETVADPAPTADPEVDAPPPVTAEDKRRSDIGRFLPAVAAAVGGGVVGGLLVAFLAAPQTDTVAEASIDSRIAILGSRLDALESAQSQPRPASSVDSARLAAIDQQIAQLKSALDRPPASPAVAAAPDIAPLEARLAELEARPVASPAAPVDLSPIESRMTELADRVGQIEAHPPSDPKTEAAARLIALASLKQAANGGGAFETELATVQALGVADPALAELTAAAKTGAPSLAALQASFSAVADKIHAASTRVDPNAGMFDRLAASASSLVSVRPAGPVEGSSAVAILSRMEAAVGKGDLAAALQESEALDSAAKAPLAEWAEGARRRLAIDTTLARLTAAGSSN